MHLSEKLQPYHEKTFVLVTGRLHAKFYRADQRAIDCLDDRIKTLLDLVIAKDFTRLPENQLIERIDESRMNLKN